MTIDAKRGTRWGRTSAMIAAGLATMAASLTIVVSGVYGTDGALIIMNANPADANATGLSFSSAELDARDVAFGTVPVTYRKADGTTGTRAVLRAGFAVADMNGLCVSKTEKVPILNTNVTIKLTSKDDTVGLDVHAQNATFDLTSFTGSGTSGIQLFGTDQIGQASTDLTTTPGTDPNNSASYPVQFDSNPLDAPTASNGFGWTGIDASSGKLYNVTGTLWQAQIQGSIKLPNLNIQVGTGVSAC